MPFYSHCLYTPWNMAHAKYSGSPFFFSFSRILILQLTPRSYAPRLGPLRTRDARLRQGTNGQVDAKQAPQSMGYCVRQLVNRLLIFLRWRMYLGILPLLDQ